MNQITTDMMIKTYKDIQGYKGKYQISNTGEVLSVKRKIRCKNGAVKMVGGRIKSLCISKRGYLQVSLSNKSFLLHRLVAMAFIPNPNNKPCVNHINGVKTDNRIANLEWATISENNYHAYREGLKIAPHINCFGMRHHLSKAVIQCKGGVEIAEFGSMKEAYRITGIDPATISRACKGMSNHAGGYNWEYKTY